jgi:hypothetical protein
MVGVVTASHQAEGREGVAERARSISAARLSRSVKGGITKTIGGLVSATSRVADR